MKKMKLELHTQILIGLILGVAGGLIFGEKIVFIKPVGDAFIKLIVMIVVPLVFASLIVGTASLGDIKKLGRIGVKTLLFFLITTVIAIAVGLILANTFNPGSDLPDETKQQLLAGQQEKVKISDEKLEPPSITETLVNIIPDNPVKSLSESIMLQIIFFAIFFGVTLTLIPKEKAKPVIAFFDGVNDAMIKMVLVIMKIAPIGVFALIAAIVGKFGKEMIITLAGFVILTIAGFFIHSIIVFPAVLKYLAKFPIGKFFRGIREAQFIAFSSTSSGATLPVNIECCTMNLGAPKDIASFVLPLGATINMNGTSLYQATAALFIAQVYGIDLTLGQQLTIVLTATLGAIGTAGVPSAGTIMLALVLKAINLPLEGIALVLGVDRIIDMFRTTLNITGDAACTIYVSSTEGELKIPEEIKENSEDKT